MIKDLLVSFRDNVKNKSSNPFLGTYALVWSIRNWRLVYSFFFFDSKTTLNDRIDILASYYTYKTFIYDLGCNILWAIVALILSYLLINLSRLIVNLFEKQLTPFIYKITDSDSIVLKETYDRLKSDKRDLEIKLEKERESKGKMQKEISSLEERNQELFRANDEPIDEEPNVAPANSTKPEDILFNKLKKKNLSDNFLSIASSVENEADFVDSRGVDGNMSYYIKLGLVQIAETEQEWVRHVLTENGRAVLSKLRLTIA